MGNIRAMDAAQMLAARYQLGAVNFPDGLVDGQLLVYNAATDQFVAANPTGTAELASAANTTNTVTSCLTTGGLGTYVVIPSTSISVPASGGRPVTLQYGCVVQQVTNAGDGSCYLTVEETTAGNVALCSDIKPAPASLNAARSVFSMFGQFPLGVVASTRTFRLKFVAYSSAGGVNINFNALNSNTGAPSFLRAVAG